MINESLKKPVFAVVVSYNDPFCLIKTIQALINQVDKLLVVDNGSTRENLGEIKQGLSGIQGVELLVLKKNMGIGYALNLGLKRSKQCGYQWLLTLDQDSVANENMVERLYEYAEKNRKTAVVFPSLINSLSSSCGRVEHKNYAITSGNLINVEFLNAIGGFNEDYFIDGVDFEFCLRVANAGFFITRINDALLNHRLGDKKAINILGCTFFYTEHPPLRRYYIFRNHLYLTRDFIFKNTFFVFKKNFFLLFYFIQIFIFDSKRIENLRMIMRGIIDFCLGRKGSYS